MAPRSLTRLVLLAAFTISGTFTSPSQARAGTVVVCQVSAITPVQSTPDTGGFTNVVGWGKVSCNDIAYLVSVAVCTQYNALYPDLNQEELWETGDCLANAKYGAGEVDKVVQSPCWPVTRFGWRTHAWGYAMFLNTTPTQGEAEKVSGANQIQCPVLGRDYHLPPL